MKLCKDCKHCHRDLLSFFSYRFAKCHHHKVDWGQDSEERVDGKKTMPRYTYCSTHRSSTCLSKFCGQDGRFWEAK